MPTTSHHPAKLRLRFLALALSLATLAHYLISFGMTARSVRLGSEYAASDLFMALQQSFNDSLLFPVLVMCGGFLLLARDMEVLREESVEFRINASARFFGFLFAFIFISYYLIAMKIMSRHIFHVPDDNVIKKTSLYMLNLYSTVLSVVLWSSGGVCVTLLIAITLSATRHLRLLQNSQSNSRENPAAALSEPSHRCMAILRPIFVRLICIPLFCCVVIMLTFSLYFIEPGKAVNNSLKIGILLLLLLATGTLSGFIIRHLGQYLNQDNMKTMVTSIQPSELLKYDTMKALLKRKGDSP